MATTLGAVAEGSIVYLNESGVAVPFYVAKHNYESALNGNGRTLLVRKEAHSRQIWDTGNVNAYSGCDIDVWLNGTYKELLDSFVQTAMATTKIYYTPGNGNYTVTNISRAVFILSLTELGLSASYANTEGTALSTAGTVKKADQWTRTPSKQYSDEAYKTNAAGEALNEGTGFGGGVVPALTMPSTSNVDASGNITAGSSDSGGSSGAYTKLEYIQSSGTQHIDTNFAPDDKTRVVVKAAYTATPTSDDALFGVRSANTNQMWVYYRPSASSFSYRYGNSGTNHLAAATPTDFNTFDAKENVLTINSTSVTATDYTFEAAYPIFLFAVNNAGTAQYQGSVRLYSCQIYDSGTLVRDFVPARRNSDGAIGLLDQANNVFYANAGTGTFTAGPVAEYTWLEWIESSGTQWIDTGFVPNQDTRVVFDFEYTKAVSGAQQGVFGSRIALRNAMYLMWTDNGNTGWRDGYGTELKYPLGSTISGRVVVDKNKNALSINGTVVNTATYAAFNSTYSLYLLTTNNAGSPMIDSYPTYARIYACQIYDNGTLVRDLVPAKRSDGTVGLYDKANDRFYTNSGTGVFTAGPEVVAARSLAMIDDTEYPIVQGYVRVNGISYPMPYALVLIDDVEYTVPFGGAQQTISFYIETDNNSGVYEEYQAENGMTWAEWVESEYNTDGFYVKTYGNYTWIERTINNTEISVQDANGDDVQPSDAIVSDYQYQAALVI